MIRRVMQDLWIGFARCQPASEGASDIRQRYARDRDAADRAVAAVTAASGLCAACSTSRSHTCGVAAAVAAPAGVRIGVDLVEMARVGSRHARAVLSDDEWKVLAPYAFIRPALAWALKEAAAKALENPLRSFPHGLRIEAGRAGLMVREVPPGRHVFTTGWGVFGGLLFAWIRESC